MSSRVFVRIEQMYAFECFLLCARNASVGMRREENVERMGESFGLYRFLGVGAWIDDDVDDYESFDG